MAKDPFLPAFIKPMLAVRGEPFDSGDYLFEIKWDGIRMLAFIDADGYRLMNRHRVDVTARYPEFGFLAEMAPGTILDGEMVVFSNGKPDFSLVQGRDKIRAPLRIRTMSQAQPATLVAFDLLYENHVSLLKHPLFERRGCLDLLVERSRQARLVFSHGILGHGQALFAEMCSRNLEGIVAKRVRSRYRPGKRSDDWIKIKPKRCLSEA